MAAVVAWRRLGFSILGIFLLVFFFSGRFGMNGYGYLGKVCKSYRIALIPANKVRVAKVEINKYEN